MDQPEGDDEMLGLQLEVGIVGHDPAVGCRSLFEERVAVQRDEVLVLEVAANIARGGPLKPTVIDGQPAVLQPPGDE